MTQGALAQHIRPLLQSCNTAERARISQEVTPHVLRHTFATLAIQMAAIQKILGHDRLGTTAIYLNLTDTHVVDEYSQKR
jgi:integrase/recombinase XerD